MTYMVALKTALTTSFKQTFDQEYPVARYRDLHVSMEYPVKPQEYPGLWIDFDDTDSIRTAGVDHEEYERDGATLNRYQRWKFTGVLTVTCAALTSLERDSLYDEVVKVVAFGSRTPAALQFRQFIEDNPLIAVNLNFDEIQPRGNAVVPGTPWGTDEIIYERSLNIQAQGEFVSDALTGDLVPLSEVRLVEAEVISAPQPPASDDGWI